MDFALKRKTVSPLATIQVKKSPSNTPASKTVKSPGISAQEVPILPEIAKNADPKLAESQGQDPDSLEVQPPTPNGELPDDPISEILSAFFVRI